MATNRTEWTGDYSGSIPLGTYVACHYNTVVGEIPYNATQLARGVYSPGDEIQSTLVMMLSGGERKAYVNGIPYDMVGGSTFTIPGAPSGFITIDYIPDSQAIRLGASGLEIVNSHLVTKPIPFRVNHITEIVNAIHVLQRYSDILPTRFLSDNKVLSKQAFELASGSDIFWSLFRNIDVAIHTLYRRYEFAYVDPFENMDTSFLNLLIIENIRARINYLEDNI